MAAKNAAGCFANRVSRQRGITFPLLSDYGSATIKRYGILNPVPEMALGPNATDQAVKAEVEKYVSVVNPNARTIGIAFPARSCWTARDA